MNCNIFVNVSFFLIQLAFNQDKSTKSIQTGFAIIDYKFYNTEYKKVSPASFLTIKFVKFGFSQYCSHVYRLLAGNIISF